MYCMWLEAKRTTFQSRGQCTIYSHTPPFYIFTSLTQCCHLSKEDRRNIVDLPPPVEKFYLWASFTARHITWLACVILMTIKPAGWDKSLSWFVFLSNTGWIHHTWIHKMHTNAHRRHNLQQLSSFPYGTIFRANRLFKNIAKYIRKRQQEITAAFLNLQL